MFLRWDRSDLRESLEAFWLLPKRSGWGRLSLICFFGSAVENLLSAPVILLGIMTLLVTLIASPFTALMVWLGLNLSTGLSLMLCLSSDFAPETCLLWLYAWVWPAISWVRPYALLTLRDQAWMSRSLPMPQHSAVRAVA
jgi:hypothetical protein